MTERTERDHRASRIRRAEGHEGMQREGSV
jgi:hypothetical protein